MSLNSLFEMFFLSPLALATLFFLITTGTAIRAVVRGRHTTNSIGVAAVWIVFLLGLAGFAVLNIIQCQSGTTHDNMIRAMAYAVLGWCIVQFFLYGFRLWRTKRDTVRASR